MEEAGLHDEDNAYDAGQLAQAFDLENLPEVFSTSPYRHYDALREVAPMKRLVNGSVFLTRYADLEQAYRNPKLFSSDKKCDFRPRFGDTPICEHHTANLVMDAGTSLTLCIGAANRDARKFEKADRLDIGPTPNCHLAFAGGTHPCRGMSLARLEAGTAIAGLLARFPAFALDGEPVHGRRARFRGYSSIPVRVG